MAALVAGAAGGFAVAQARHDTTEPDGLHVIAVGPLSPRPNGEFNDVTLGLLNTGSAPVGVIGVELDGFYQPAGGDLPEPIDARPGTWTNVVVPAGPDCTSDTDGEAHIRLRGDVGGRSTLTLPIPNHDVLRLAWLDACGTRDGIDPG